jgi:antitoxin (DNA-binding transcriptional repressor) of toxin-antitoxin stability system
METVSIRKLRGEALRERARKGKPLAITNRGALIGVVIPVAAAWVEHLIDYNWSHVRQSVTEGEQTLAVGTPLTTIQDVIAAPDVPGSGEDQDRSMPERLAVPLVAALTGGVVAQAPETEEALQRLQAAWNPPGSGDGRQDKPTGPSVQTVRIGNLTAGLIEKAGAAGQTLAITYDRELIGMVIPVTRRLVEFLLEQNMSRVLYNIALGEKQLATRDKMTTLGQVVGQTAAGTALDPEIAPPGVPAAGAFQHR